MTTENPDPRCEVITPDDGTPCGSPAVATATQAERRYYACQTDAERAQAAGYAVTYLDTTTTTDPAPR